MPNSTSAGRRFGLVAVAAMVSAATLIPATASAAPTSANASAPPPVSKAAWAAGRAAHGSKATASQAIAAYWTPERMRAAQPVEEASFYKYAITKHESKTARDKQESEKDAKQGKRPPEDGKPFSAPPAIGLLSGGTTTAAHNPNLGSWHPTARTNGKVFFMQNGQLFVCSASIVNSEGADTVWTAGHCVHSGSSGSWHTNWQFVPAFDDDLANPRPYGTWTANQLHTRTAWINSSNMDEDMGVATMNANLGGWHIVDYFGGQGFRVNQGKDVWVNAFGYPAEAPFDGGNLYQCWGTSSPEWTVLWWSSETIKIPCDMTRGSSGGPWLHGWNGNWGYLNGVNSRIDRIVNPTIMLSPYFDGTAMDLYDYTRHM